MRQRIPAPELRLADVVQLTGVDGFNTAVVRQIKPNDFGGIDITMYRPYAATDDFSYTGGVICYVGIEEWTFTAHEGESFDVLRRKILK